jgi:hypothetical protein
MAREFQPFEMERMQSKWENAVQYNLSESGVHPLTIRELVPDADQLEKLLATRLEYPQANGIVELRDRIAALYPGATHDHVLVTVGCAEANKITLETMLRPGDEAVVMLPNYMQVWGAAKNLGATVKEFHLREDLGWAPDLDELSRVVTNKTRLIAICNPDNPTGYILKPDEIQAIISAADRVGAWILADEIYSGAEQHTDVHTPTIYGRYDRVICTNGLSKANGLPGLRIGWVVAPPEVADDIWARHEYTTISAGYLDERLATYALTPEVRARLIRRSRDYVRRNYSILDAWIESHEGMFSLVPPQAAAIAFIRYNLHVNSTDLIWRLIREKSVLIVPGDHFGMDHFVRIGFGNPADYVKTGLDRIHELMASIKK